ncbi:uncharacterized protein LOC144738250 [Lampetra planeri]
MAVRAEALVNSGRRLVQRYEQEKSRLADGLLHPRLHGWPDDVAATERPNHQPDGRPPPDRQPTGTPTDSSERYEEEMAVRAEALVNSGRRLVQRYEQEKSRLADGLLHPRLHGWPDDVAATERPNHQPDGRPPPDRQPTGTPTELGRVEAALCIVGGERLIRIPARGHRRC